MTDSVLDKKSGAIPAYSSYKTFISLIDGFRDKTVPSHIDRTVMSTLSGGTQAAVLAAFKFFALVDTDGSRTDNLVQLVDAKGVDRQKMLDDMVRTHYSFLFTPGFDLQSTTPRQIDEKFSSFTDSSDMRRKCIAFFVGIANDAGIPLSPHLIGKRGVKGSTPRKPKARKSSPSGGALSNPPQEKDSVTPPTPDTWSKMLLGKFPDFDPTWSPELKEKWFSGFQKLMAMGEEENTPAK